jgi:hypothetical protein
LISLWVFEKRQLEIFDGSLQTKVTTCWSLESEMRVHYPRLPPEDFEMMRQSTLQTRPQFLMLLESLSDKVKEAITREVEAKFMVRSI